jgi:hypothetical protein
MDKEAWAKSKGHQQNRKKAATKKMMVDLEQRIHTPDESGRKMKPAVLVMTIKIFLM